MRTRNALRDMTIGAFVLAAALTAPAAQAQAQPEQPEQCGSPTVYSPARGIALLGIENCAQLVREIEKATEIFLSGECHILEARKRSLNPHTYGAANALIQTARAEFNTAGETLVGVAEQIDESLELEVNEGSDDAARILKAFDYPVPTTYQEAFSILADAISTGANQLADVTIEEDDNVSFVLRTIYDATIRPAAVFRAITILVNPDAS